MTSISALTFVQDFDASHIGDPGCPLHKVFSSAYTQDPEEREMEIKRQDLKIETYVKSMHEHLQELKELMSARATPQQAMELIIML